MLLLEPSLRYALGGNFPFAAQSQGTVAAKLFKLELLVGSQNKLRQPQQEAILTLSLKPDDLLAALKW